MNGVQCTMFQVFGQVLCVFCLTFFLSYIVFFFSFIAETLWSLVDKKHWKNKNSHLIEIYFNWSIYIVTRSTCMMNVDGYRRAFPIGYKYRHNTLYPESGLRTYYRTTVVNNDDLLIYILWNINMIRKNTPPPPSSTQFKHSLTQTTFDDSHCTHWKLTTQLKIIRYTIYVILMRYFPQP